MEKGKLFPGDPVKECHETGFGNWIGVTVGDREVEQWEFLEEFLTQYILPIIVLKVFGIGQIKLGEKLKLEVSRMNIAGFSKVKVLAGVVLLWGSTLWAVCIPCGIQGSSVCRPWGKGQAYFKWATGDQAGSSITLTAGPCGQLGETGTAYILSCVDDHRTICDGNENTNPCGENTTNAGTFAVIKVTGNNQAFQHIFPNGLSFMGDYPTEYSYMSVSVLQTGCEYPLQLSYSAISRIALTATVEQCDPQYSGSHFGIDVKLYQKRDFNNDVYS
jgi:hypothetical protein